MDEKKIKKVAGFLGLYYLLFAVYIKFPEAHSLLGDLYQGELDSYTVLEGIHNHPSDVPFVLFDNHSVTLVHVDKFILCTTCTFTCPGTQLNTHLSPDPSFKGHRLFSDFFCRKPVATAYHTRAPPSESA